MKKTTLWVGQSEGQTDNEKPLYADCIEVVVNRASAAAVILTIVQQLVGGDMKYLKLDLKGKIQTPIDGPALISSIDSKTSNSRKSLPKS